MINNRYHNNVRPGLRLCLILLSLVTPCFSKSEIKLPTVEETEKGRTLVLPDDLTDFLATEFPGYRVPSESEFNPEMLSSYFSRLIGVHPAVTWGDFNGDKKQDYALLLVTGESKLGPLVELVILNGERKKGDYTLYRLSEVYSFKDDYVSFEEGKLTKGKFKKNGWRINWNPKKKFYDVLKY